MSSKKLRTILIILILVNIIGLFVIISVINSEKKAKDAETYCTAGGVILCGDVEKRH